MEGIRAASLEAVKERTPALARGIYSCFVRVYPGGLDRGQQGNPTKMFVKELNLVIPRTLLRGHHLGLP